eukprot:6178575-Pleurochrysis_carterae.AAC.1
MRHDPSACNALQSCMMMITDQQRREAIFDSKSEMQAKNGALRVFKGLTRVRAIRPPRTEGMDAQQCFGMW